jgi:two-component system phosphate regulon sensor histidine kinase PhoR
MSTPSLSRPLLFFYILVIYVLLQFSWWAYLLIDLNKAVYGGPSVIMPQNDASTFEQKWKMVAGEGIVFLAILVFGIYKTRQAFQKEFALARQQRNFLLSITHEFKSPLAAIKLGLQTIQKRNLDGEQMSRVVTAAISETDRINMLLEDTLMAARIESKNFELSLEVVDFSDCCSSVIQHKQTEWMGRRKINARIADDIRVKGDPLALTSILVNLMDNADKYSPKGMPIHVDLVRDNKDLLLTVSDFGSGIPPAERSAVFRKFYRLGNEETRRTTGTGLGLYIVKNLVDLHKGKVSVSDNQPSGAVFKVTLPLV